MKKENADAKDTPSPSPLKKKEKKERKKEKRTNKDQFKNCIQLFMVTLMKN